MNNEVNAVQSKYKPHLYAKPYPNDNYSRQGRLKLFGGPVRKLKCGPLSYGKKKKFQQTDNIYKLNCH